MDFNMFLLFVGTTLVVIATPGAAAITITAQGSGNGVWKTQAGILGVASANAVYFALSALGIASIIIASHLAFTIIKWVGVAYLVYLGLSAMFSKSGGLNIVKGRQEPARTMFTKGFIVEFANPKALLYFAAILPQFLDLSRAVAPQILIMGATTAILDILVYSAYAALGHSLSKSRMKNWLVKGLNKFAGGALLFTAFRMSKVHS